VKQSEVARLLAYVSAFDRRNVHQADELAWLDVLDDLPYDEAKEAVRQWYSTNREWIMPGDIRSLVKAMHTSKLSDRTLNEALTVPAADPDDVPGYIAALRAGAVKEPEERLVARPEITAKVRGMWAMPKDAEEAAAE
jgi:HD-like signal output (HDOD) protein